MIKGVTGTLFAIFNILNPVWPPNTGTGAVTAPDAAA